MKPATQKLAAIRLARLEQRLQWLQEESFAFL
jgi:hypothetical protein